MINEVENIKILNKKVSNAILEKKNVVAFDFDEARIDNVVEDCCSGDMSDYQLE